MARVPTADHHLGWHQKPLGKSLAEAVLGHTAGSAPKSSTPDPGTYLILAGGSREEGSQRREGDKVGTIPTKRDGDGATERICGPGPPRGTQLGEAAELQSDFPMYSDLPTSISVSLHLTSQTSTPSSLGGSSGKKVGKDVLV